MTLKVHLKWVVLAVIGLFLLYLLGTLLFFNATPKEKRVKEPIESSYTVKDEGFRIESGLLTGRQWVEHNDLQVFTRGEDTFSAMLEDIRNAEKSILKETYNFYGEEVGELFAEALAEASERGVNVHFLMDYVGSAIASGDLFDIMDDAEVEVERWRRPSWYQLARLNHRTHRKLLTVDGRYGYTGGVNTADPWLPDLADGGYKDYHFRFKGPVVNELSASFSENWVSSRGKLLLGDTYYPAADSSGLMPMQVVSSHPREGKKLVRKMLLYSLASAEETVRIGSAYFFPDDDFIEAIARTAERGVEVTLLTPNEDIDQPYVRHASHTLWGRLYDAGVNIYEYQPAMYHAKVMIVDEYFVSVGSTNFDNRSFRLNDETNVNVLDEGFGSRMAAYYDEDLAVSERISREEWEQRPVRHRIWGHIVSRVIGPYL